MSHSRNDLFKHIFGADPKAGGVDAGMTADIWFFYHITVDEKTYFVVFIIHQSHDTYRAWSNVQKFFHIVFFCKRKSCRPNLGRQIFCFKFLIPRDQKQVKVRFLAVAEKQILADYSSQYLIGFLAGVSFQKGLLRAGRAPLAIFGAVSVVLVYGGIMNPASAILYQPNLSLSVLNAYYLTGFPFDLVHAAATALFLWFGAEPMLEKLERVKRKYGLTEAE